MAAGRPTKYHDRIPDMIQGYLDNHEETYGDLVPSVEGLSLVLDVRKETLYEWDKDPEKHEFSNAFNKLKRLQAKKLLNGGLGNKYNHVICKMMLTHHGYTDKVDHSSSDGTMSPKPALDVSKLDTETLAKIESAFSNASDE